MRDRSARRKNDPTQSQFNAPTGLRFTHDSSFNVIGNWSKPSSITGAVSYEVQSVNSDKNASYSGNPTTIAATTAATVTHNFGTSLTVKFRVRTKVGNATSAWAEYISP